MNIKVAGENSLIIYCFDEIQESHIETIRQACHLLKEELSAYIIDIVPSYTSIWISFDILQIDGESFAHKLQTLLAPLLKGDTPKSQESNIIKIPILYNEKVGLDLKALADEKALTIDELIQLHSEKTYSAFATGFALGFSYLGIVNERLITPRHATPRAKIPRHSLGIADNQTAIYPIDSPGGWKIIGKTPLRLFDSRNETSPNLINIGDKVKFEPIDEATFLEMGGEL